MSTMSIHDHVDREDFDVECTGKSTVHAAGVPPQTYILHLSNLDLLSGRFPVTYLYVYPKPTIGSFSTIAATLKTTLAQTLKHYYPFAGRIVPNPETGEPEIVCDNHGVHIVEAHARIPLASVDYYNLNHSLGTKLAPINHDFPFHVQVTSYTCGGISISFNFDHALADAFAFGKFLLSWSEIARGQPISCAPNHHRLYLHARSPPIYNPTLDQTFITCKLEEILSMPANNILLKRLYYVDASDIDRLQELSRAVDGCKRTKIEAMSAYLWKIMAGSGVKDQQYCKMGWLVDGRTRMGEEKKKQLSSFVGNVVSMTVGEAPVQDLREASLARVAGMAHEAIVEATNEEHFLDLIDWIEIHKPGLMLAKILLGRGGGPALIMSSGRRFPVAEIDFGFGAPVLGTCYSTISRLGAGFINQQPSAKGDGSWVMFAILWPALAAALESDPDHVLQPMSASHMGLV